MEDTSPTVTLTAWMEDTSPRFVSQVVVAAVCCSVPPTTKRNLGTMSPLLFLSRNSSKSQPNDVTQRWFLVPGVTVTTGFPVMVTTVIQWKPVTVIYINFYLYKRPQEVSPHGRMGPPPPQHPRNVLVLPLRRVIWGTPPQNHQQRILGIWGRVWSLSPGDRTFCVVYTNKSSGLCIWRNNSNLKCMSKKLTLKQVFISICVDLTDSTT